MSDDKRLEDAIEARLGESLDKLAGRLTFVDRGSDEWLRMWSKLAAMQFGEWRGDTRCECPETGETWQYMGTLDGVHEFRHRNHPLTGTREHCYLPAKEEGPAQGT